MKLRSKVFAAFFIIILVPVVLMTAFFAGFVIFQSKKIESRFGIDLMHLTAANKALLLDFFFLLAVVLIITAVLLSAWLYHDFSAPLEKLAKATRNIRDGNLDFELKAEGVAEIRSLCEDFEEMRVRLKAANEEKIEFDRQNRELISNISHDLRTPITAVKGYVEGIMDGVADTPEKMNRYIHTIYNKTIEMDRLINELSFYSKIATNRIPYAFDRVPVRGFFDDAAEELENELTAKGVTFTYRNEVPDGAEIIADVEQIRRVINNIVGNSVKYMDKPVKTVSLTVTEVGDEVQTAITDNGKGIEAKNLASVFDRFYRTDSSRNSAQGGSGIGLSIVRKIVEDHGGRVWASSREGEGTTMFFVLRKYQEAQVK